MATPEKGEAERKRRSVTFNLKLHLALQFYRSHFDLYSLRHMNVNNCAVDPGQIYALIKPSVPCSNVIEI